jgi:hypothetical protein
MPLQLEIPEGAIKSTKAAIAQSAKETLNNLNALVREWEALQPVLTQLEINVGQPIYPTARQKSFISTDREIDFFLSRYDRNWTWLEKARFVLGKNGGPMSAKDIIETIINKHEQDLSREKAMNSMPGTLSVAFKEGKINRQPIDGGEFEYLL